MNDKVTKFISLEEKKKLFMQLFEKNAILWTDDYAKVQGWQDSLALHSTIEKLECEHNTYYTFHVKQKFTVNFNEIFKTNHPARCIRNIVLSEKDNFSVCAHGLPVIPRITKFTARELESSNSHYITEKLDGIGVEIFKHDDNYIVKNKHSILFVSKDLKELNFASNAKIGDRIKLFLDFLNEETMNSNVLVFEICAPREEWEKQITQEPEATNAWLRWLNLRNQTTRTFIPIIQYKHYNFCLVNIVNFPYSFYDQYIIDDLAKAFDIPRPMRQSVKDANIYNNSYAPGGRAEGYVLYMYDSDIMAKNKTYTYELQKWAATQIGETLGIL